MKVSIAQLGARMHYAVPAFLEKAGVLSSFYTDVWYPHITESTILGLLPKKALSPLAARSHPCLPSSKTISYPLLGLLYKWELSQARGRKMETEIFLRFSSYFAEKVAESITQPLSIFYAFNTAALEIFERLAPSPTIKIVEQTLVPRGSEVEKLAEEYAFFGIPFEAQSHYHTHYHRREQREWEMADHIVCGSQFVKDELLRWNVESHRITVIPYGFTPPDRARMLPSVSSEQASRPIRLLFAGNGGIRKGIRYLAEASLYLGFDHEIIIAGLMEPEFMTWIHSHPSYPKMTFVGRLNKPALMKVFAEADIFVYPSLCEGSATAIYEALSFELPIVCTPESGSVVTNGKEGVIIPSKRPRALADGIEQVRNHIDYHSKEAGKTSKEFTQERYQERLLTLFHQLNNERPIL